MVYLVVEGSEDKGVYSFESRGVAEDIAKNYKQSILMHEDELDKALKLVGSTEPIDAIFLIRKFRSEKNKTSKVTNTEKVEHTENKVTPFTYGERFSTIIRKMNDLNIEAVKLTMFSGEEYIISVKSLFFTTKPDIQKRFLTSSNNEIQVNTIVVDDCVSTGEIGIIPRSKIEYVDNYAVISGCDDRCFPDVVNENNKTTYKHHFSRIVINTERVETIVPFDIPSLGNYQIQNETLVKYLVKKML